MEKQKMKISDVDINVFKVHNFKEWISNFGGYANIRGDLTKFLACIDDSFIDGDLYLIFGKIERITEDKNNMTSSEKVVITNGIKVFNFNRPMMFADGHKTMELTIVDDNEPFLDIIKNHFFN